MIRTIRAATLFLSLCCCAAFANADSGLVTLKSHFSVTETLDRFESAIRNKGMSVFARVDHRKGATGVGLELRPTEVLIFGNPKIGTLLMQGDQSAGIDLPLKALAWQDEQGAVWLSYNDPAWIVTRHGIKDRDAVVAKMQGVLKNFAELATQN
jgi:uncharacterized protein (DUF302 family)